MSDAYVLAHKSKTLNLILHVPWILVHWEPDPNLCHIHGCYIYDVVVLDQTDSAAFFFICETEVSPAME